MKSIKVQLQELLKGKVEGERFEMLWFDFVRQAAHEPSERRRPERANPNHRRKRFVNLYRSLRAITPEDMEGIWINTRHDNMDLQLFFNRISDIAEHLSKVKLNPSHRPKGYDTEMQRAYALWAGYVKRPIGTNEAGPFARFARLFISQSIGREYSADNALARRIRNMRGTIPPHGFPSWYAIAEVYGTPAK